LALGMVLGLVGLLLVVVLRRPSKPEPAVGSSTARTPVVPAAPAPADFPFDARMARQHQDNWARYLGTTVETVNSLDMRQVLIPPGAFPMGESQQTVDRLVQDPATDDFFRPMFLAQAPEHQVRLTRPFWLGRTEVTVAQFRRFVESTSYR